MTARRPRGRARSASVVVGDLRHDGGRVGASIRVGDRAHDVFFEASGGGVTPLADPFVAAALLPAMRAGADLEVEGTVSPGLLDAVKKVQKVLANWEGGLSEVSVRAQAVVERRAAGASAAGCLFSGGVDSFHAALAHSNEISALVFVHGFDVPLERPALRVKVAHGLRSAAEELGTTFVEIETDLRRLTDPFVPWRLAHGAGIAAATLLLSPQIGRMHVPGSLSYDNFHPYGSHPLLDPLWGTGDVELVYDGFEVSRFDKVAAIASDPVALRWLRVCPGNRGDAYNCGRCEKCLRTMAALRAVGALERSGSFPTTFDPRALTRSLVFKPELYGMWERILESLEASGADPELAGAIRRSLAGGPRRLLRQAAWRRRARRRRRRKGTGDT